MNDIILMVEDDEGLAKSLEKGLNESGYQCEHTTSAGAAMAILQQAKPLLVLLDLGLPDADGIDVLKEIRQTYPHLPVIITTARSELSSRLKGFSTGADDYLIKPYAFEELLARIHIQLRHSDRQQAQWKLDDLVIDLPSRTATRSGNLIDLTPREFDLLAFLASLQGETASRQMLQESVWNVTSNMTSMDNVIDVHISRLRQKLNDAGGEPLLHTVRGVGFVLKVKS